MRWFNLQIEQPEWLAYISMLLLCLAFALAVSRIRRRLSSQQNLYRWSLFGLNFAAILALFALILEPQIRQQSGQTVRLLTDGNLQQLSNVDIPNFRYISGTDPDESDAVVANAPITNNEPQALSRIEVLQDPEQLLLRFQQLNRIEVVGDGLYKDQWRVFSQVAIDFQVPELREGLVEVDWARQLNLGEYLNVKGRIQAKPNQLMTLQMLDPAGDKVDEIQLRNDDYFKLRARPKTTGLHTYQLKLLDASQTLIASESVNFQVRKMANARILVIQSAPSFEVKQIQNWAAENGASLLVKTQISRDRFIDQQINLPELNSPALNATLLAQFDLLIIDGRSLSHATPFGIERDMIIDEAITKGLGVLIIADQTIVTRQSDMADDEDSSTLASITGIESLTGINLRTRKEADEIIAAWSDNDDGIVAPSEHLLPTIAATFTLESGTQRLRRVLVQTTTGEPLVVKQSYGTGHIAVSLLRETHRWVTRGEGQLHSHFWQNLIHELARTHVPEITFYPTDSQRFIVKHRSQLCVSSSKPLSQISLIHRDHSDALQRVPLQTQIGVNGRYCGFFWPHKAGWYQVYATILAEQIPEQKSLSHNAHQSRQSETTWFYVEEQSAWHANQQRQKIKDTLWQKESLNKPIAQFEQDHYQAINRWYFWWMFIVCVSLLWVERKIAVSI